MTLDAVRPLCLGPVKIGFPVVQSALSGYSDWPMRAIARRYGAPYTLCEVMLDQLLLAVRNRKRTAHLLHLADDEHPVGGQLMGAEPDEFAAGALRLVEAGFDVIDINFGCPVKKVVRRRRGGYLLAQPQKALEIVGRTRDVVPAPIPVTVKMRCGVDRSSESSEKFFEILDGVFAAGAAAVTVHGRTVQQGYIGPSRRDVLAAAKRHAGHRTILGSGDLFSAGDCLDMMRATGVDGVTVARGAIGNPWIFHQVRQLAAGGLLPPPPSLYEQRAVLREHWRLAQQLYGPQRCGRVMRKFGVRYAASHPNYEPVRTAFARVRWQADWDAVLDEWYAEDLPGRYPPQETHCAQR